MQNKDSDSYDPLNLSAVLADDTSSNGIINPHDPLNLDTIFHHQELSATSCRTNEFSISPLTPPTPLFSKNETDYDPLEISLPLCDDSPHEELPTASITIKESQPTHSHLLSISNDIKETVHVHSDTDHALRPLTSKKHTDNHTHTPPPTSSQTQRDGTQRTPRNTIITKKATRPHMPIATRPTNHTDKTPYRARGLDGLRAIACLAVLLYHFFPNSIAGGFLGVDVFFVLSGFLITGLLVKEHRRNGRINLKNFWTRRIRRLLPAVSLMLVLTIPIAWGLNKDLLVGINRQVFGVLTFSYNWVEIIAGADYFDQTNPHMFTNVWSLGVEEQFYVIWPLIMVAIMATLSSTRRAIAATIPLTLALLSAWWMSRLIHTMAEPETFNPTRAYMGTDSHAFGLMLGAALALLLFRPLEPSSRTLAVRHVVLRGTLAWCGIAGTLISFIVISDSQTFTYPYGTLLASLCVLLFLQATVDDVAGSPGPAQRLFRYIDCRFLTWIGQRSYGIYLWHWPLLVIFQAAFPLASPWVSAPIVATTATGIAAASYRYMENPIRRYGIAASLRHWFKPDFTSTLTLWRAAIPLTIIAIALPATVAAMTQAPKETSVQVLLSRISAHTNDSKARKQEGYNNKKTKAGNNGTAPKATEAPMSLPVAGDDVLVIGDSVTLGAKPIIEQKLPGVVVDGEVSRSIFKALPLIDEYRQKIGQRKYVVISLVTNSAISLEQIDAVMKALDPSVKTVWVNGFGPARCTWIPPSNDVLQEAAAKYPDRVRVANWHDVISGHEDLLAADLAHPANSESQGMYAQVIVDALNNF